MSAMKILFLTYHGFDPASGITKKMLAQMKGLRQNGHEVHVCTYDLEPNGDRCRYVDGEVIKNYGKGWRAALQQRFGFACIEDYCKAHQIEMVYARHFMNASPAMVRLFKRLRKAGIRSVMEVPTYPYDQEFKGFPFWLRCQLHLDQLCRAHVAKQMEGIVTFSDEKTIFGQRTIRISNGVDLDVIPLHRPVLHEGELHLIGVAEVHVWHGFDRLIRGLGEYYRQGDCPLKVFFHIVGGVASNEMYGTKFIPGFRPIIEEYGLQDKIVFHGQLFGQALDDVFNQCSFAIGSLGRHRSGISFIKTLKNREYASRGIPFIYSECDSDFDDKDYVIKAPADESPIDVNCIIDFMEHFSTPASVIRESVKSLSWESQMQRVVEEMMA